MSEARPFAEPLNAGTEGASGMLLKKLARAMFLCYAFTHGGAG